MKIGIKDLQLLKELQRTEKDKDTPKQSDEFLLESIKNLGLNEPLTIMIKDDSFILIDGYRRYKAIKDLMDIGELNEKIDVNDLPVVIVRNVSPIAAKIASDIRQDLKPSERAHYIYLLLKEHNMTRKDIARMFGWQTASIANWLIVRECIPKVQSAIDKEIFPMSAGKIFGVMTKEGQLKLFNKLKGLKKVTRTTIRNMSKRISSNYFNKSYEERMKISESVRKAKKGYKHTNRTILKVRANQLNAAENDIATLEDERILNQQDREILIRKLRILYTDVEIWLQRGQVKKFIKSNYPDIYESFKLILYDEIGVVID